MNLKIFVLLAAVSSIALSHAENIPAPKKAAKNLSLITIPAKGKAVLFNGQKSLSTEKLKGRLNILKGTLGTDVVIAQGQEFTLDSAFAILNREKANVGFFLIDNPSMPMSLVCLEEGWAMVNFSKLNIGTPDEKTLARRFGAELNRVIRSLLAVGENGRKPIRVLDTIKPAPRNGADLDKLVNISIPVDEGLAIHGNMPSFGVSPERQIPYLIACKQGWAPLPTNAVQKAIWDKVHQLPSNPIKIKPETKKVAE